MIDMLIFGSIICGLAFSCINALMVSLSKRYMYERGYHSRFFLGFTDFCEYTTILTFVTSVIIASIPFVNIIAIFIVGIVWLINSNHDYLLWRPFKWLIK